MVPIVSGVFLYLLLPNTLLWFLVLLLYSTLLLAYSLLSKCID